MRPEDAACESLRDNVVQLSSRRKTPLAGETVLAGGISYVIAETETSQDGRIPLTSVANPSLDGHADRNDLRWDAPHRVWRTGSGMLDA